MSLRLKLVLIILLIVSAVVVSIYFLATSILLKSYERIEEENMINNIQRVEDAGLHDLNELSLKLVDWSNWDDTYKFMSDNNKEYLSSNLNKTSFKNLKLHLVVFIDTENRIVYKQLYDSNWENAVNSDNLQDYILKHKNALTGSSLLDFRQGIIALPQGNYLITTHNILTSENTGPSRGTIIFGKLLDKNELGVFSALTHLPLEVEPYTTKDADFSAVKKQLSIKKRQLVVQKGNIVSGYSILPDLYGSPILLLRITSPRIFYVQGVQTVNSLLKAIVILGLISGCLMILLFEKLVVSRIYKLTKQFRAISELQNLSVRVEDGGNDEIGKLGNAINDMLNKLSESHIKEDAALAQLTWTDSRLEEKLLDLQKFQLAVENTYEHVIITDSQAKILYANASVERITGFRKDEIIGNTPSLWGNQMPKEFYQHLWDTIQVKKVTFNGEIRNKRKNGEIYTAEISISPIMDENKKIKFFVGVERDVSQERKLTEDLRLEKENVEKTVVERTEALSRAKDEISRGWLQVQQEKARLTASINSLPLGFIMTDVNHNIISHNPVISKIFDVSGEEIKLDDIGEKIKNKFDLVSTIKKSIEEKKIYITDDIQLDSKFLKISTIPIVANFTEVIGTVILIEDTTDVKVLERARNEFFSIASHELRTPLTSIKGNTSLIKQYYSSVLSDPNLKEMIEDIHESSNRLILIVNDFLDVSRIEQGRITYKMEKIDVLDVVDGVVHDIQANATAKGIKLNIEHDQESYFGMADKDRTQQIVYNLLGNAIKFTEKGEVKVNLKLNGNSIEVRIQDSGAGISVESRSLLFRKFQQASDNPLTRQSSSGTGLGLYISKTLAQGMKGDVVLESSEVNVGSTFLFTIPASE